MQKQLMVLLCTLCCPGWCHKLAVYWGQDPSGGKHLKLEESLFTYCSTYKYDIIPVGFLNIFFDAFNIDHYPSINLANHCNKTFKGYPGLLDCPEIGQQISKCQQLGKKMTISLGGAAGSYSFTSSSEAHKFAYTVWNLFLGGSSNVRPFESSVLDGIDLDIEALGTKYFAEFVKTIRLLMNTDASRYYLITGAPQCPYPDVIMGPGAVGTVLQDVPQEFDYLFVQFYNNYCYLSNTDQFQKSLNQWFSFAASTKIKYGKGPLILIGLPSATGASSGSRYYQTPQQVEAVYETVKTNSSLGGFMLWDASFDRNNVINGEHYSTHIFNFLDREQPTVTVCVFGRGITTHTITVIAAICCVLVFITVCVAIARYSRRKTKKTMSEKLKKNLVHT